VTSSVEATAPANTATTRSLPSRRGLSRAWRPVDLPTVGLTVLAFAVASVRLGTKSLWLDEAVSVAHANLGLSGLWKVVSGRDPNMGLYYVLLHFWVRIFGDSEASVRSLAVLAGGLTVPVIVMLGRRLFGYQAGLIAGLLLAVGPFFVRFEQTARGYSLVVLLVVLSSYLFVAQLERPTRANRIGYVAASVLAVYAHYFAVYVLLVQFVTLLTVRRSAALRWEWLGPYAAIALMCAPEVVFAARAGTAGTSWISRPSLSDVVALPRRLSGSSALSKALVLLAGYAVLIAVGDRGRWRTGFVAAWCIGPVVLDYAESMLVHPLFIDYYLIIVLPAFLLLAAAGVARLPGRATGVIVAGLLVALSAVGLSAWYRQPGAENYRGAMRYILGHEQPGDGVIYDPSFVATTTAYYAARFDGQAPRLVPIQSVQTARLKQPRVWLVLRNSDQSAQERRRVEELTARAYPRMVATGSFNGLTLVLYAAR
jgi:mannosyltransferase